MGGKQLAEQLFDHLAPSALHGPGVQARPQVGTQRIERFRLGDALREGVVGTGSWAP